MKNLGYVAIVFLVFIFAIGAVDIGKVKKAGSAVKNIVVEKLDV